MISSPKLTSSNTKSRPLLCPRALPPASGLAGGAPLQVSPGHHRDGRCTDYAEEIWGVTRAIPPVIDPERFA